MTRADHVSGSDRLAEAVEQLGLPGDAVVVNVQGDEPLIEPAMIDAAAALLLARPQCVMSTVAHALEDEADFANPNVVKLVTDAQGLAVPGVTVTATSPNLQGARETVSSANGDYILSLLPPGAYTLTFELTGFERQRRTATLAPTQVLPLEVTMGPAVLTESVQVVGRSSDVLTQTAQVATNFKQELISALPTNRDLNASVLQAPAVHATGPSGASPCAGLGRPRRRRRAASASGRAGRRAGSGAARRQASTRPTPPCSRR